MVTVYVLISDEELAGALIQWLRQHDHMCVLRFDKAVPPGRDDFVVASARDCPPDTCRQLAASGARVIVLVPSPRATERDRYFRAGATAYLAMALHFSPLLEALRDAVPGL